jgi:hypothetical protein
MPADRTGGGGWSQIRRHKKKFSKKAWASSIFMSFILKMPQLFIQYSIRGNKILSTVPLDFYLDRVQVYRPDKNQWTQERTDKHNFKGIVRGIVVTYDLHLCDHDRTECVVLVVIKKAGFGKHRSKCARYEITCSKSPGIPSALKGAFFATYHVFLRTARRTKTSKMCYPRFARGEGT